MTVSTKTAQWLVIAFFASLVALVFQQIYTSMTEQGIASGGPYDNAATFPKSVAIVIAALLIIQIVLQLLQRKSQVASLSFADLRRPIGMLIVFGVYLWLLTPLGYHVTTAPMIFCIMWICGARNPIALILTALAVSLIAAFIFEKFLSVVLPGGIYALHIPW